MGLLDHSTNNILIDAVLTDKGRGAIALNNFKITQYAFFDDEIDYTIIKKYGKTIGREKIEKNTPIFEASTSAHAGLKHNLLTLSSTEFNTNSQVATTPQDFFFLELSATNSDAISINSTNGQITPVTLTIKTKKKAASILSTINQQDYRIEYDFRFISIEGQTGTRVGTSFIEAVTISNVDDTTTDTQTIGKLDVVLTRNENLYAQYKDSYVNSNNVSVPVKVIEVSTGISKTINISVQVNS